MLKAVIKVKPELLEDTPSLLPYFNGVIEKINYNYGRNLMLHSWQLDENNREETENLRTVELSMM